MKSSDDLKKIMLTLILMMLFITFIQSGTIAEEATPIADLSCLDCHSNLGNLTDDDLTIPGEEWFESTHKYEGTTCTDCHGGDASDYENPMDLNFVGIPERNMIPEICGKCHLDIYEEYEDSIHNGYVLDDNKNVTEIASVCTDCHGIHHIERTNNPESPVYSYNVPNTCAQCHDDTYYTYEDSYHGIFLHYGNDVVATCADCHTNHDIKSPTDPTSQTHPLNLPETCSKCHTNNSMGNKVAEGYQHFEEHAGSSVLVFNKDKLDFREASYYIGPFDTRFWIPFFFNTITMILIPSIILLVIVESLRIRMDWRRLKSKKKE